MDLKKNVKTYLYVKKSQLFDTDTIFPIAMQESTQNIKLTLKMCFWGSSDTSIFNFIFFFEKLRLFYIRHLIFRLRFARVHNDFSQSTEERFALIALKKKIIVKPYESQSENYMSYIKKSQLFKKNIKLRIEVAGDPQKHIFRVNFRFWVLSCIAIGKIVFFSKSWDFFT